MTVFSDRGIKTQIVAVNSENTPLGAGVGFTSGSFVTQGFTYITGTCLADEDGTLAIDFSPDGTNWNGQTSTGYNKDDPVNFKVPITDLYARITFLNGAVPQTSFELNWNLAILP